MDCLSRSRIFELTWRQPDHLLQELVWGVEEHGVGRDQMDQQQNLENRVFFLEIISVGKNHLDHQLDAAIT